MTVCIDQPVRLPTDGKTREFMRVNLDILITRIQGLADEEESYADQLGERRDTRFAEHDERANGLKSALKAIEKFKAEVCNADNGFPSVEEFAQAVNQTGDEDRADYAELHSKWVEETSKTDACTCDGTRLCRYCSNVIQIENDLNDLTQCYVDTSYNCKVGEHE